MLFSYKILTGAKELKTGTVFCEVQIFVASHECAIEYQKELNIIKEEYSEHGYSVRILDNLEYKSLDDHDAPKGKVLKPYICDIGKVSNSDLCIEPHFDNEISSTCFTMASEEAYHIMGSAFGSHDVQVVKLFANPNRYFANLT